LTVTIREVADAAGVSTATVSRALSGVQTVDPELVARVRQSAEALGYRANRVARALRRQSTQTVGLVIPDITHPFFPPVVQAVEKELRRGGLSLLLCDAGNDVDIEAELVRNLFDHQIDGLLISVCDRVASRPAVELAASRVPVLQIGQRAVAGVPCVGVDQADAIARILGHLREQGCQRFAYIGPRQEIAPATERLDEFLAQVAPLDAGAADRVCLGGSSLSWGHEAAAKLLADKDRPDAIVCATDQIALGALRALNEHRVKVPGDVAVTGFGDTVLASAFDLALTSIRQPLEELGTEAVRALNAAIEQHLSQPQSAVLKGELIVRASSRRT
jgi:LacI family transcriptional regulator